MVHEQPMKWYEFSRIKKSQLDHYRDSYMYTRQSIYDGFSHFYK
jgi:hypothetical protein